jgi:dsRNA-specific ribonuclease
LALSGPLATIVLAAIMSNALKRCRSKPYVKSRIADIPQLRGNIVLQVFTHKSLEFPGSSQKAFGYNARLAELGQQALELAVTDTLFHLKQPVLDVEEIAVRC